MPDTPGTGAFPAIKEERPELTTHVVYRPRDLASVRPARLGVIAWGNGGCAADGAEVRQHLLELASRGYVVIVPGRILTGPDAPPAPAPPPGQGAAQRPRTTVEQVREGLDWALAENAREGSPFYGKINPQHVAVSGWSCGGIQALQLASDPRVRAVVLHNTGLLNEGETTMTGTPLTKELLSTLRTPVIYILGGERDIAYQNGMDDFRRIGHVPAVVANLPAGHAGTFFHPNGGRVAQVAAAWLEWQLRRDALAGALFLGPNCGLCINPEWTIERKGIE
jgi:dienelactone hydrolase